MIEIRRRVREDENLQHVIDHRGFVRGEKKNGQISENIKRGIRNEQIMSKCVWIRNARRLENERKECARAGVRGRETIARWETEMRM